MATNEDDRPLLRLRFTGGGVDEGEIPLDDLARIAQETQGLVRRLGRGLVDQRGPGKANKSVEAAVQLRLVGLKAGSTVLEIAGPTNEPDVLAMENLPPDLGERALDLFTDALDAVATDAETLPVGFDSRAASDLDGWFRVVRKYESISIQSDTTSGHTTIDIVPGVARKRLKALQPQPSMPFVSPTEQALEGDLYALNINTGTYSIEDDSGHKIRLRLPEILRADAAVLVTRRVRAIGLPELDDSGRIMAFEVSQLTIAADLSAFDQGAFFQQHELVTRPPVDDGTIAALAIPDLTEEEADSFMNALAD